MNITEDYCSYEVAKLLKEKGFDDHNIRYGYNEYGKVCEPVVGWKKVDPFYLRPTHQMAMKWLREEHNIDISVVSHSHKEDKTFEYEFVYWNGKEYHMPYDEKRPTYHELFGRTWKKYEDAVEAALKYSLENLILL